jgi:hypothetical protein
MSKNTPMTPAAASRIQSHADQTETNADFKARAQLPNLSMVARKRGILGSKQRAVYPLLAKREGR